MEPQSHDGLVQMMIFSGFEFEDDFCCFNRREFLQGKNSCHQQVLTLEHEGASI